MSCHGTKINETFLLHVVTLLNLPYLLLIICFHTCKLNCFAYTTANRVHIFFRPIKNCLILFSVVVHDNNEAISLTFSVYVSHRIDREKIICFYKL